MSDTIRTRPSSKEYDEGFERTFGERKPERGRFIYDAKLGRCVPADEYRAEERAVDAPIMVDRFYEGARATDGTDIGSRRKHRAYMREHGLTTADDYKGEWAQAEARRQDRRENLRLPDKNRREAIARALDQRHKP